MTRPFTQFLCANHRQWLFAHLDAANTLFDESAASAEYYKEQGQLDQAAASFGCAFETAELLLTSGIPSLPVAVIRLTSSAISLIAMLQSLQRRDLATHYAKAALNRLCAERSLHPYEQQACLNDCIKALEKAHTHHALM